MLIIQECPNFGAAIRLKQVQIVKMWRVEILLSHEIVIWITTVEHSLISHCIISKCRISLQLQLNLLLNFLGVVLQVVVIIFEKRRPVGHHQAIGLPRNSFYRLRSLIPSTSQAGVERIGELSLLDLRVQMTA